MKNKARHVSDLVIGLLCICTVILGYYKDIRYMGEYCFISGLFVGIVFLCSFVYRVKTKKNLPLWLYFDSMITLLIIMIATVSIGLNLEGAFWFIHIINPIVVFLYWCIFCNHLEHTNKKFIVTDVIFPACYFLFAFILRQTTGVTPFPASMIFEAGNVWFILGSIIALCAFLLILGKGLHFFNRLIRRVMKQH